MTSTRPIRALIRGLDALRVLNTKDGATVSEVAGEIDLPRTTTYRILETLCSAGYAYRAESDDRYRLTIMVRGLSDGYDDEVWVTQIGKPFIYELCRDVVWPISIATLSGNSMLVRQTTDHKSPLAVEHYSPGFRVPILGSASGICYLAFCTKNQRETLLEILARSKQVEDHPARNRVKVRKDLAETRNRGFAIFHRPRRVSEETTFSVPILASDRCLAALTLRFSSAAVPQAGAVERFIPKLRQAAEQIGEQFAKQQDSEAQAATPDPAQS
jgi:IclR family mhp operon transcriptional activator